MSEISAPTPVDSATVILLQDADATEVEVLLVARHAESRAFAGAHVFPGGLVDPADSTPALVASLAGSMSSDTALAILGADLPSERAVAFWIAAIRELFEEAGILLAAVDGTPVGFTDPAVQARFAAHRRALLDGGQSFAELVARERLTLLADELVYFSRWITPLQAPRRYDARFFAARVPAGQIPLHDARETTAAEWMRPTAALARAADGSLVLTPPTARTLEELEELGGSDRILATAAARRVLPILPKVVQIGAAMGVLYPGDADYEHTEPGQAADPDSPGPLNRVIMDAAGWKRFRGQK